MFNVQDPARPLYTAAIYHICPKTSCLQVISSFVNQSSRNVFVNSSDEKIKMMCIFELSLRISAIKVT